MRDRRRLVGRFFRSARWLDGGGPAYRQRCLSKTVPVTTASSRWASSSCAPSRSAPLRSASVSSAQIGISKVCSPNVRTSKIGPHQFRADQICASQIRFTKVRSAQIPAIQIHGTQIRNVTWILFSQGIPGLNIIFEDGFFQYGALSNDAAADRRWLAGRSGRAVAWWRGRETRIVTLIQRVR